MTAQPIEDLLERRRRRVLPPPAMRRLLRERLGLSQAELATAVGVSRVCVTRWENGTRHPRGVLAEQYGAALDRLAAER